VSILLKAVGNINRGCVVGVVKSRKFLGGVGFLPTLGVGVGFFCPTTVVQLDHFLHALLNCEFLLKWYTLQSLFLARDSGKVADP